MAGRDRTGSEKILKEDNQAGWQNLRRYCYSQRSSKAIDRRVIIKFCDENAVIASFRDKNDFFFI